MSRDLERAVVPVAAAFEILAIEYCLTGSVASSLYGVPRASAGVDVVAQLQREHILPLLVMLRDAYFADEDAALDAIQRASRFSVVHLATMLKVDIYIASTAFDRATLARAQRDSIGQDAPLHEMPIIAAADLVIHKLRKFTDGGSAADRHWSDVIGILRVQRALDLQHLRRLAAHFVIVELLHQALRESDYED